MIVISVYQNFAHDVIKFHINQRKIVSKNVSTFPLKSCVKNLNFILRESAKFLEKYLHVNYLKVYESYLSYYKINHICY